MTEINWDKLRREALERYTEEGRRRQKAGDQARADAEELAYNAARLGLTGAHLGALLTTDQDVYVYKGSVMLAHLEPQPWARWTTVDTPEGTGLATLLWSKTEQRYIPGPSWRPGEWNYVGVGAPNNGGS